MFDDLLPFILEAYYKPTDQPWAQTPWRCSGPAHVDHNINMPEAAGLVSRRWRVESRIAQKKAIKAVRAAFFSAVVDQLQMQCLDDHGNNCTPTRLCLMRHNSVTLTVVKTSFKPYWTPPELNICFEHRLVDSNQTEVDCLQSSPQGLQRAPVGSNYRHRTHLLGEMPHLHVRDKNRTEEQKAEARAWLADFGRTMLAELWQDFGALNDSDWHRQRFHVCEQAVSVDEPAAGPRMYLRFKPPHGLKR
jgi:hypothetical protein